MRADRIAGFELQGHRGARALFPENTLEGVLATLACGVDAIELDIAVTADDVAVVVHDPALHPDLTRGPDGAFLADAGRRVRDLGFAELQHYDVGRIRPGSALAARFPLQAGQDGLRIPALEAVLRATAGSPARFEVELKTHPLRPDETVGPAAMAELVLDVADRCGARGRVVMRSFDWRGLAHLRRIAPELPLVWLSETADLATLRDVAEAARGCQGAGWAPAEAGLEAGTVAAARAAGLRVLPWTVNDPGRMAALIDWGVDGLCTDHPVLARAVMAEKGLALPSGWFGR